MASDDLVIDRRFDRRSTVVLVDEQGATLGTDEKVAAHLPPGMLHLAFSVVLYREDGRTLLQQRSATKYHFPLAWANACCSHPSPGEDIVASAEARLFEELGIECRLTDVGTVTYRAACASSGLVEHELDHVLIGVIADAAPVLDPSEVAAVEWVDSSAVISSPPKDAAPWLVPVLRVAEAGRVTVKSP